jgi:hypothetical protein
MVVPPLYKKNHIIWVIFVPIFFDMFFGSNTDLPSIPTAKIDGMKN